MWSFLHLASGCFFSKKRFDKEKIAWALPPDQRREVSAGYSHSRRPCALLCEALRLLHGAACDREWANIKEERNNAAGVQAKKPWELFTDRTIRWQLLTIILLNTAQQLNGINAVRTAGPDRPADSVMWGTLKKAAEVLFFLSWHIFCRSTFTQIACSSKPEFRVTKSLTWPLGPVPVNASRLWHAWVSVALIFLFLFSFLFAQ